jgi:biopolymer transport protein ExbD
MRIRHHGSAGPERVELNMTSMIDIVFQLLAFFVVTLKPIVLEGDFNIKMPLASASAAAKPDITLPPIPVRIVADEQGNVASIRMGDQNLGTNMQALRSALLLYVGNETGPGSLRADSEVELDADYNLRYEHAMAAITMVTGYVHQGQVVKLIEKVKFAPPRKPPS